MSETQQPEPITAWAAFDHDGIMETTVRGSLAMAKSAAINRACGTPWGELEASGVRIAKVEIREVTQ